MIEILYRRDFFRDSHVHSDYDRGYSHHKYWIISKLFLLVAEILAPLAAAAACNCDPTRTKDGATTCNGDGTCDCLSNFEGPKCERCSPGYYNYECTGTLIAKIEMRNTKFIICKFCSL